MKINELRGLLLDFLNHAHGAGFVLAQVEPGYEHNELREVFGDDEDRLVGGFLAVVEGRRWLEQRSSENSKNVLKQCDEIAKDSKEELE